VICRPAVWLLDATANMVVRLARGDPSQARRDVTSEAIRDLVTAAQSFSPQQRAIIGGAFEITGRVLHAIVVPRRQVLTLPADLAAAEGVRRLTASGHSRAPVTTADSLDHPLGIVHVRDLIGADGPVAAHVRPPLLLLPETLPVCDALRRLRQQRQHMALVVDEHGGVEGIITLEDLLEEVVGEIYSDTDSDVQAVTCQPDGVMLLPGTFPVHDLPDLGVHLADTDTRGPYVTIAGLLLARLGRIPAQTGGQVRLGHYTAEVSEVTCHAITQVRLHPAEDHDAGATTGTHPTPARPPIVPGHTKWPSFGSTTGTAGQCGFAYRPVDGPVRARAGRQRPPASGAAASPPPKVPVRAARPRPGRGGRTDPLPDLVRRTDPDR